MMMQFRFEECVGWQVRLSAVYAHKKGLLGSFLGSYSVIIQDCTDMLWPILMVLIHSSHEPEAEYPVEALNCSKGCKGVY